MHILLLLLILLAFPLLELWLLIGLAHAYGWLVLVYLVLVALLGWRLILDEKLTLSARMTQSLMRGENPAHMIFGSAKNLIAGILLIIPGVISDAFAVILLLLPGARSTTTAPPPDGPRGFEHGREPDVIEGEFRRED